MFSKLVKMPILVTLPETLVDYFEYDLAYQQNNLENVIVAH